MENYTASIIDGKKISNDIKNEIKSLISSSTFARSPYTGSLPAENRKPALAVVLTGSDPASLVYVKNIKRSCESTGVQFTLFELPYSTPQAKLIQLIAELNQDTRIDGIHIQFPVPEHIDEHGVMSAINCEKDMDCIHPYNIGKLMTGEAMLLPCTPAGIVELLKRGHIKIESSNCVVIGRSNIVGKPVAQLLLAENATVTVCHSKTKELAGITSQADILVAAVGKPGFVTADMVKDGAAVIDVGIHSIDGKLCGDVDFDAVSRKAAFITPVPGGVGPMTTAILMKNCITAYRYSLLHEQE